MTEYTVDFLLSALRRERAERVADTAGPLTQDQRKNLADKLEELAEGACPETTAFRQGMADLRKSNPEIFTAPKGVVMMSRHLARDPVAYRQWKAEAEKAGKELVIEQFDEKPTKRTPI